LTRPDARVSPDPQWRAGVLIGALAGLGVAYLDRRLRAATTGGLVDWGRAERQAVQRLRRAPGALDPGELRRVAPDYDRAMRQIVPALEAELGTALPGVVERHAVVDRQTWAAANLEVFREIYGRIEAALGGRLVPRGGSVGAGLAAAANRFAATQQVAFFLGYLGTRVLGQYDIALLSAEARPGQLLFVEENIRSTAATLRVPVRDFRTWVALHETTHAFEFEAHPWVRSYLSERLERQLAALVEEAHLVGVEGVRRLARRLRQGGSGAGSGGDLGAGGGVFGGLMTEEQRRSWRETQVMMSLLEGFSDWVMDRVGQEFIPDVPDMRRRFEERRGRPRSTFDRIVSRVTGMDLKIEQYRRGERFVAGVAAIGGRAAVDRLWDGPGSIPTETEMADPAAWVRRVAGPGWSEPTGAASEPDAP
jgi:coenzyme F420 biosynthesis associated uncharacterized protein